MVKDRPIPIDALMRLLAVSRQLSAPLELGVLLGLVVDVGREVLHAERGTVLLYDDKRRELVSIVATDCEPLILDIDLGIAGASARGRQTINVPDVSLDPRFNPLVDRATGYHTLTLISVPLIGLDEELVGVMQFLNPARGSFDSADVNVTEVLASHAAVAIQRERLLEGRLDRLKMERDLEAARIIQEGVLPRELPVPRGYSIAAMSRPADQTGGDIYDVVRLDADLASPIALLLADASGHGIAPALSVLQVRAMLRMGLLLGASLADIVSLIDGQLYLDLADDQFVTAFVGSLDPIRHDIVYHAAGQGPLLHYHAADGRAEWRQASALPLGISVVTVPQPSARMSLDPGDFVALLTDGIYECTCPGGDSFGVARVVGIIERNREHGARGVLDALLHDLDIFADGVAQTDDFTAIVIQRNEAGTPP